MRRLKQLLETLCVSLVVGFGCSSSDGGKNDSAASSGGSAGAGASNVGGKSSGNVSGNAAVGSGNVSATAAGVGGSSAGNASTAATGNAGNTGGISSNGGANAAGRASSNGGVNTVGGTSSSGGANTAGKTGSSGGANTAGKTGSSGGANTAGKTGSSGGANTAGKTGSSGGANTAGKTGSSGGANTAGRTGSSGGANTAGSAGTNTKKPFNIVGYVEDWSLSSVDGIQYDKLTHIIFGFAVPNDDGTLQSLGSAAAKLNSVAVRAHEHSVPVLLSIGGWNNGDDSAFHALAATESTRNTFADAAFSYVQNNNLDGVDIDWEFPETDSAANYTALMAALSRRLRPAGKLLTTAANFDDFTAGGITSTSYQYLDLLMVMSYGGTIGDYEGYLNYWLNKSFPREKLVMGVSFYSDPSYTSYGSIVAGHREAAQLDSYGGESYNGIPTIRAKTQIALDHANGMMMWELAADATDPSLSLLNAIYSTAHP